ncbi:hypothetical protein [Sphingomicrobium astaxanthinifaciens]|uniref:hypothetical protein n=1 Tax=Sphingomicrobium astaxanthinifaciens TaxID=1227949 RepID=UPI001FCBB996|nr:hypothetical protein [Sphingomicrobium astaxanthinifaciens]MCJ7422362.1 hypothetical protein [Sphingomicrobium astaxanthinifaciens]
MPPIASAALAIAMLAAFLLGLVGAMQSRKPDRLARQRGWLMIAMALILVANVLIWTL